MIEVMLLNTLYKFRIVHSLPGRLRLHIPLIKNIPSKWHIDSNYFDAVKRIKGISKIEVCFLTGNALIIYDKTLITENEILKNLKSMAKLALKNRGEFENYTPDKQTDAINHFIELMKENFDFIE
ncbi:hypothetical protein J2Z35_000014 [Acetoanaerobium pronyense]|uniref:Uncharacterized protein n=1 Tax=Acetoanaerobium pronyense TaxID=1482736 RepID=A0ABS4KEP5_9FIRM|nr:hypothetical protein [Acetoanaerobium pronyense]MBP2026225.1 hypothetical protein [Acetoanaerobium pronyense]